MGLTLTVFAETLAICRLDPGEPLPGWAMLGPLFAITRTPEELSVVCSQACVPPGVQCEPGWRALQVEGPLDFGLTGILAGLAGALARAQISLFGLSTYDTDYILVKSYDLPGAIEALRSEGYVVKE